MIARFLLIGLALAAPVSAEVVHADAHGFEVRQTRQLAASPAETLTAFGRVSAWWAKEHSYSGNPANLSLELRPGGCFCEKLPGGGGIEHLRVAYVDPGKEVALTGALGPLLYEAVTGVMHLNAEAIAGGTRLVIDYRVAGFANGGGERMSVAVDKVLAEQADRLRDYANRTSHP